MISLNDIELLSPAGDFECAKAAIDNGADSIYMGGEKFSARAYANSANDNSIIDSIKYVKAHNKKFYLAINTLFKEREIKDIFSYVDPLAEKGIDAFIVADLGVSKLLKERYNNISLHASTQMTITSYQSINMLYELGFEQIVLSRELSLNEIKNIRDNINNNIKLEAFVHGSMCYCYSGACLMSSVIGIESGNRGRCKGPCRLKYKSNINAPYILSMKDMCALDVLYDLIISGVCSFKIEGRMRKPDYVAGTTKIYRKSIDSIINYINNSNNMSYNLDKNKLDKDKQYLLSLYNKGGFTHYYNKHNGFDMIQKFERKHK